VDEITVDRDFLLIGFGVSLVSGILFSLGPALQAFRRDLISSLNGSELRTGRLSGQRFRKLLVSAQVALVVVLLSGAGLMTNTIFRLLHVDLGFSPSHVFRVQLPDTRILHDRAKAALYLREFVQRIRRVPGGIGERDPTAHRSRRMPAATCFTMFATE
jgi:hypothetical protein